MRRAVQSLFYVVMVSAAVLAGFMATDQNLFAVSRSDVAGLSSGAGLALSGLFAGLILAWLLRVNWSAIPLHIRAWIDLQRRRFWWFFTATASLAVLIFY
ncbi:MAG TPA: hypothetical protein PK970_02010 [Hyphomicrobiaceae bacterium]|nr:hypothetical protein [Hyphomicrobiaceae bacterium]